MTDAEPVPASSAKTGRIVYGGDIAESLLIAHVTGAFPWMKLSGATIRGDLHLRGDGTTWSRDPGDGMPQIEGRGLVVEGNLILEDLCLDGIVLNNARIRGDLRIIGCTFRAPRASCPAEDARDAFRARDLRVDGSLLVRPSPARDAGRGRTSFEDRLFLAGATVAGTIEFIGVAFAAPRGDDGWPGKAVTLANARIGGDLAWREDRRAGCGLCTLAGRAKADSITVGGRVRIEMQGIDDATLSLRSAKVTSALLLGPCGKAGEAGAKLRIDAEDAKLDAIVIDGYAAARWQLDLHGASYTGLSGWRDPVARGEGGAEEGRHDDARFLRWFREHVLAYSSRRGGPPAREPRVPHGRALPSATPHQRSPQPYQAFARFCRANGFRDEADDATVEWMETGPRSPFVRVIHWVYGASSRYGLSMGRVTSVLALHYALCASVIALGSATVPRVFVDPPAASPAVALLQKRAAAPRAAPDDACVAMMNPFVYALDVALPLASFGAQARCPIRGWRAGDAAVGLFAMLVALLRLTGAILTAILVLTYSGVNRRILQ